MIHDTKMIHQNLPKKIDWSDLKSNVDKLQVDKLKNAPTNWINIESKVDKLDIDKLVPVPVDLSKLSDVVKNYFVKKNVYDAKIKTVGNKKSDVTNLASNASLNAKINEVKGEIPDITNFATNTSLNAKINEIWFAFRIPITWWKHGKKYNFLWS